MRTNWKTDRTRTDTLIGLIMHYDKWMFDEAPIGNTGKKWMMGENHKDEYESAMLTLEKRGILELNLVH